MKKLMVAVVTFAGLVVSASAVSVHSMNNWADPRYFTTGCKFGSALAGGKASIGIWVKNITGYANGDTGAANVFGNLHVDSRNASGGLMLSIRGGSFRFEVEGKASTGVWARHYLSLSADASRALMTDGGWHFLLGTCDVAAQTARFFIDGQLVAENAELDLASVPSGRCFAASAVGKTTESTVREVESYGAGYNGLFAEATIWNRALTAVEAADLFTRRALMWESGLVGYWPLAGNAKDCAFSPATREDGSVPDALFYFELTTDDPDFFPACPGKGRFVISPEMAVTLGYTVPAGCDYSVAGRPATNIQDAVDAAASGDTVYVFSGHYPLESEINLSGKSVSLQGIDPIAFAPDRDGVVIDGQGRCRTLLIERNDDRSYRNIVDSLTLTNGNACVRMYNASLYWSKTDKTMELLNCRIAGNRADSGCSGVFLGKQGLVSNCVFAANYASSGSVVGWTTDYASARGLNEPTRANVFRDCLFVDNTCGGTAALLANGVNSAQFYGCTFSNNFYTVEADVNANLINLAGDSALFNCTVVDNAQANGRPNSVVNLAVNALVKGCVIRGNRTSAYVLRALENQANARVEDSRVEANGSTALAGCISARNTLLAGNGENCGYEFQGSGVASRVENCTFVGFYRSVYVSGANEASQLALVNSIMTENGAEELYLNVPIGALAVTNCCLATLGWNPDGVPGGVPTGLMCNRWTRAPGFKDAVNGDYTLWRGAFAREKGVKLDWMTDSSLDLAGDPRLVNRGGVAYAPDALPDLGCYECQEHTPGFVLFLR